MSQSLNKQQEEAVLYTNGPLLILAGAGSGKTRVITHRIAHMIKNEGIPADSILAITFTNKAAKEMKERAERLVGTDINGAKISTFHSFGVSILRQCYAKLGYKQNFTISDESDKKARLKETYENLKIDPEVAKLHDYPKLISDAKMKLLNPNDIKMNEAPMFKEIYTDYEQRLFIDNTFDFDDLIKHPVELFRNYPNILEYYRDKYHYIMVDEYQDTDHAQFELIRMLAEKYGNICVVGDDDQSIYSFRGADISNILDFCKEYPNAKTIKLEENYRSTSTILSAANDVIHNNIKRKDKTLYTQNPTGEKIKYITVRDQRIEANIIARSIKDKIIKLQANYSDFAILYRLNAQSRAIEEAMLDNKIPYRIVGGTEFYSRQEIKDLIAYLKIINDGSDTIALKRIVNVPSRGISKNTVSDIEDYATLNNLPLYEALKSVTTLKKKAKENVDKFINLIEKLKDEYNNNGLYGGYLNTVLDETDYWTNIDKISKNTDDKDTRRQNILELSSKLNEYIAECQDEPTLTGFLENIALITNENNDSKDAVLLMTLHSAKGLEFEHVFIPGAEEGIFPFTKAEDIEEERRLAYVGITRAKKTLTILNASTRMIFGRTEFNDESRFIKEIQNSRIQKLKI